MRLGRFKLVLLMAFSCEMNRETASRQENEAQRAIFKRPQKIYGLVLFFEEHRDRLVPASGCLKTCNADSEASRIIQM